jgi:hypothetical protein
MEITSTGIDLGKTMFHLVALNHRGKVLLRYVSCCDTECWRGER